MQSPGFELNQLETALLVDAVSSKPEQSQKYFGTEDSLQLGTSHSSVISTIEQSITCTFIIPSRNRKPVKRAQAPAPAKQETGTFIYSASMPVPLSPKDDASTSPHSLALMSESWSSGTFGAFSTWDQAQTITNPNLDSGNSRRVRSLLPQKSPLAQLFVPPRFGTPMVESFSDGSADGMALLTPTDVPFSSEAARAGDDTGGLTTSDTRASLFTISAYSRTDNLKTPVVCSEPVTQEIVKPTIEPTRRVSFINLDHPAPSPVDNYGAAIMPSTSASTLRRPHRPSHLTLEQDDIALSYPMFAHNVSQTTASSTRHVDSDHSSAVEETPVHRVVRRGARYTQASTLPSLPIVEFVKRVYVELRIDQEEHGTIRPQFTFKRHIAKPTGRPKTGSLRRTASKNSDVFWDNVTANGLVDMRMSAKEIGTFHCGTISREAVLRRVVVDGDDHRDHLTANVVLPLKENGVYTVHGVERERKKTDPKILVWKFEYTVEDKKLSQTGQLISGEKLLRPISFICSPELLLPSQGTGVTIMHLLSKKFTTSPTAIRIPPPVMPAPHPVSATSDASEYSFNLGTVRSSSRSRRSRIGTAIKALSRPTTPATDYRLRNEYDDGRPSFSFSRRTSVARSYRSEPKGGKLPALRGEHPRFLSQPASPWAGSYKHAFAVNSPQLPGSPEHHLPQKWTTVLGKSVDSLPLTSVVPQRPHTTESSLRRPHTAGVAFGKSLKHMSGAITGNIASKNRPATAGSQPSGVPSSLPRPKRSSFRRILQTPMDSRKQEIGLPPNANHSKPAAQQPLWHMPTEAELDGILHDARGFIAEQQKRLEILAKSRRSRDTSIERVDSSGDISLHSDHSFDPPQKPQHHFTRQPIASPRTLEIWTRPSVSTRRPSTTSGELAEGGLGHPVTSRSSSFATFRRPHTSDGPNQEALFPSHFSLSRNASNGNLGLPHPPRRPRAPLRQES